MDSAIKKFVDYLNNNEKNKVNLLEDSKKVSLQIVLHKILNLKNDKHVYW